MNNEIEIEIEVYVRDRMFDMPTVKDVTRSRPVASPILKGRHE